MKNLLMSLATVTLLSTLLACHQNGNVQSAPGVDKPVFSQSELLSDTSDLRRSERVLRDSGFIFASSQQVEGRRFNEDQHSPKNTQQSVRRDEPSEFDLRVLALQNYVASGLKFWSKYGQDFVIQKQDGRTYPHRAINPRKMAEDQANINLAEAVLTELQDHQTSMQLGTR